MVVERISQHKHETECRCNECECNALPQTYCNKGCVYWKAGERCERQYIKRMVELNIGLHHCHIKKKGAIVKLGDVKVEKTTAGNYVASVGDVETPDHCIYRGCRLWEWDKGCNLYVENKRPGEYGCVNFVYKQRDLVDRVERKAVVSKVKDASVVPDDEEGEAPEGVRVKLSDKSVVYLRDDGFFWHKPEAYGAKAFVGVKLDSLMVSLRGTAAKRKIEPELLREPSTEWKLPKGVLVKWGAMMLDVTHTEASCLYGKRINPRGEGPLWLGVVPKQECTGGSVDVDDQTPAISLLARRGYKVVGSVHTHPGGMTQCSGTDTGQHWKYSGGIHIIVTREGTTGTYFAAGGTTWRLQEARWNYGALWDNAGVHAESIKGWITEGTLVTETGAKRIGAMISSPRWGFGSKKHKHKKNKEGYQTPHYGVAWSKSDGTWWRYNHWSSVLENVADPTEEVGKICYRCPDFRGGESKCKCGLTPKTWNFEGAGKSCSGGRKKETAGKVEKRVKKCYTCHYWVGKRKPCKAAMKPWTGVPAYEGCENFELPPKKGKKMGDLRESLMAMIRESSTYTEIEKKWLGDRINGWNFLSGCFHDLDDEIAAGMVDNELPDLGPHLTQVNKKLAVLAICMAGQELKTEPEYAIPVEWVGTLDWADGDGAI